MAGLLFDLLLLFAVIIAINKFSSYYVFREVLLIRIDPQGSYGITVGAVYQ